MDSVNLTMPKFTFAFKQDLNNALTALGMGIAFNPGGADFTDINADGGLFISKVAHKTFVKVNEEGAEAAAVTSVEIEKSSIPINQKAMRIDRPFIFAIRENVAGSVLFIGIVRDPVAGK